MKKVLSLFLIVIMLFSLISCEKKVKNRTYDEEEVKAAAKTLIFASSDLNYIFWGKGIGYIEDKNTSNGNYHQANPVHLQKYGFKTIEELKNLTRGVFSEGYCESIFSAVLEAPNQSEEDIRLVRYYQKYSDIYGLEPECIMVYSNPMVLLTDEVDYLLDTVEVLGSEGNTVNVKIKVNVTRGEKTQQRDIEIGLVEESGGWRIDTPTYIVYYEPSEESKNETTQQ